MDDRILQFRVGMLVIATLLITFSLVIYFGEMLTFGPGKYQIHVTLSEAPGVSSGTLVRKHGIMIGRVDKIRFDDEDVTLTVSIQNRFELTTNEICRIGTANFFGDPVLEFVRREKQVLNPDVIQHGDFLRGEVTDNPLKTLLNLQKVIVGLEDDATVALSSVSAAGTEVSTLARNINSIIGNRGEEVDSLLNNAVQMMRSIDKSARTFRDIVSAPELLNGLRDTTQQVPELLSRLGTTLEGLQRLTNTAARNLENMEQLTGPLAERGPVIVNQIDEDLQLLDDVLKELVHLGENINHGQGTVGKLLNDPELYDRLNRTVGNIEQLTHKLQPIVEDARIFSDKIARNPRQLGLRGVLDGRHSGLKRDPRRPWRRTGILPDR